jgi:hypothetical protein
MTADIALVSVGSCIAQKPYSCTQGSAYYTGWGREIAISMPHPLMKTYLWIPFAVDPSRWTVPLSNIIINAVHLNTGDLT